MKNLNQLKIDNLILFVERLKGIGWALNSCIFYTMRLFVVIRCLILIYIERVVSNWFPIFHIFFLFCLLRAFFITDYPSELNKWWVIRSARYRKIMSFLRIRIRLTMTNFLRVFSHHKCTMLLFLSENYGTFRKLSICHHGISTLPIPKNARVYSSFN